MSCISVSSVLLRYELTCLQILSKSIERVERIPCIYMFPLSSYLFLTNRFDWLLLSRNSFLDLGNQSWVFPKKHTLLATE